MVNPPLPLVLIGRTLPEGWLASLDGRVRTVTGASGIASLTDHLAEAEGLFTLLTDRVDEALLGQAPRLRVVSNMAVGVDNIDLAACTRRGLPVGNTPGVLTESTADMTMALLLSAARRLPEASADAKAGRWTTWSPTGWLGADLNGATLGIVGMGKIGAAVAARAQGFGLRIIYASRSAHPEVEARLSAMRVTLETLLRESDFVSLHVPLTAETRGLIGEQALRAMKATAILVNAARGPVVEAAALYRALSEGWIAGAALDVTDPEPLPPDHPLYRLGNCLIARTSARRRTGRADAWPSAPAGICWPGWRGSACRTVLTRRCMDEAGM